MGTYLKTACQELRSSSYTFYPKELLGSCTSCKLSCSLAAELSLTCSGEPILGNAHAAAPSKTPMRPIAANGWHSPQQAQSDSKSARAGVAIMLAHQKAIFHMHLNTYPPQITSPACRCSVATLRHDFTVLALLQPMLLH